MTRPELNIDDETLMALADGELAPETAAGLRRHIAEHPELATRLALFEDTRTMIASAMTGGAVPERLIRTVQQTPVENVSDSSSVVVPLQRRSANIGWRPLALAASVAIAASASAFVLGRTTAPVTGAPAQMAAMALAKVPTGQDVTLPGGGSARVLGSYDTDRGLCRLIHVEPSGAATERAIVCEAPQGWAIALSVGLGAGNGYVPASDAAAEMIDGYLESLAASAPLLPADEATALGGIR